MRSYPHLAGLILGLALLLPAGSQALVFELGADSSPESLRRSLRAKVVLSEACVVNGADSRMDVAITPLPWDRLLEELRLQLGQFEATGNERNIVLEGPGENGRRVRHLIVRGEPGKQATIFTMEMPGDDQVRDLSRLWPQTAPQPTGVDLQMLISMKGRGVTWGQFETTGGAPQVLLAYESRLTGAGWRRISGDATTSICMSADQTHMVIVAVTEGKQRTYGSIFIRRLQ